ncbi:MAG: hypothetical protein V3U65_02500 [Granulosicoccaceae bacterium]
MIQQSLVNTVSQSNTNNPMAPVESGPSAAQTTSVLPAKRHRVVWVLAMVAFSLYFGSIAWFFVTRGAA